ncbi:transposase, partial [Escherichia coli]
SDGNGSHASTLKSPSYTKSVSWQHYPFISFIRLRSSIVVTQIRNILKKSHFFSN